MPAADADDRGLSEFEVISLFDGLAPDPARILIGRGDDAAVVAADDRLITSVDTVVEGVHFRREWSSPEQIAAKAAGAALSDLAAMGAGSGGIDMYLSVGLPRETPASLIRGLAAGFAAKAERHGATLVGGDTVASPVLFLAVTVTAHLGEGDPVVSRGGAEAGDLVAVTGHLGGAQAGLWLLENPGLPVNPELSAAVRKDLIGRQLEPVPRIAAGTALAASGARAMIDLSDGLLADLGHVVGASSADGESLTIELDAGLIPSAPGSEAVARAVGVDPLAPALGGGEEYELALALPADRFDEARQALAKIDLELTRIGTVKPAGTDEGPAVRVLRDGEALDPPATGFDHFTARPRPH